jgi:hypothetical protein
MQAILHTLHSSSHCHVSLLQHGILGLRAILQV